MTNLKCKPDGVYFAEHPVDWCSSIYYVCDNGVASRHECAAPYLAFDIGLEACYEREFVPICGGKRTTTAKPKPPKPADGW